MIGRLLLSLLIPLSTGALLVWLLWPARPELAACRMLKLSIAAGLGVGLSAETYFLWLWTSRSSTRDLVLIETALLGALTAALFSFRRRLPIPVEREPIRPRPTDEARLSRMQRTLSAAFAIALIPAGYTALAAFFNHPHGGWDAWMSWNLRARFFFRAGEHWRDAFSNLFWGANPSYPVFLPSAVARSWLYAGREAELAPALLAALFAAASVGLLYSSLRLLRSKGQALLAGLLLVSTPFFVQQGTLQTADVPIGFFLLSSVVLLCLRDRASPHGGGLLFLAGLAAGFGAWTKNEGLLFIAALLVAAIGILLAKDGMKALARHRAAFAIGLLLVLPVVLYAKLRFAPPEPLLAWRPSRLYQIADWRRYGQILAAFAREGLQFGQWPLQLTPLLAFYALLLGVDCEQRRKRSALIGIATLGLILAGYFCVFLTSPEDLAWHLRAVNRLFLQLWPSAIFLFFLVVRTPEEALSAGSRDLATQVAAHGSR